VFVVDGSPSLIFEGKVTQEDSNLKFFHQIKF